MPQGLFACTNWRKGTNEKALAEGPKNTAGEPICPTCGDVMPPQIQSKTKKRQKTRRGNDLDHFPDTWAERVAEMKTCVPLPERKVVIDEYHKRLSAQCPLCNQGHAFEGIDGDFK